MNDQLSAKVVERLAENGTRLLTLCLAGFNHVDLKAAAERDITVTRVPAYSPTRWRSTPSGSSSP